jgi:hypothetical protein
MRGKFVQPAKGVNQAIRQVLRMRGRETYPSQAFDIVNPFKECRKITSMAILLPVCIHVLAYECDLTDTIFDQKANFLEYFLRLPANLASSHIRYHTIGTKVVATLHDGHKGRDTLDLQDGSLNTQGFRGPPWIYVYNLLFLIFDLLYKGREPPKGKGSKSYINVRRPFNKTIAFLLGHTSTYANNDVRPQPFHPDKTTQEAVNLVLGLFTDRTRV